MSFTHLHVHSHYSLLNGLPQIKPLVKAAKKRGFDALALTDYGSMYGAIEFYRTCLDIGIKPIIGFEAYIAPRSRHDKDPEVDKKMYRLILLAENYEGYHNLMVLSSLGHLEGFFQNKPRIDNELLLQYHTGIIALSGSINGEIPQLLLQGKKEEAKIKAKYYNDLFGSDYFYLELEDHPAVEGQLNINTQLIEVSKELNIPLVVTRDVHYLNHEDTEAQDTLRCIGEGWKVDQSDREDFRHVDRSFNTGADIASRFRHVPEAIENTSKIADRVNIEIPLDAWHFAPVDLPPDKTALDVLRDKVEEKLPEMYPEVTKEIRDRIEYELGIIGTKGYDPYFLCVADYVSYAKSHDIMQTTRGSAAGSVVSYIIGITTVDPIRFKLPFERFLNPFRPSPPDIDTDFADDKRDQMIQYVTEKYGDDKVAQIITFGTMAARASVRDVGRALGFSYSFCDQLAKLIPPGAQGFPMTIARALREEPDLRKLYDTNADVKRLLDLAQKVEGCARHTSIHAAGVVISPTSLTDYTPIQRETGGERLVTQYEMHAVEAAGVLKMDFLGIRNLSILGKAVKIVEKTTGEKIDIYSIPLDDKKTFEMLARGETMGTFQLSGSGMTRWLKELKPTTINDVMVIVALYRPGPMDVIPQYIKRKHHPELIEYLDPRMEKYLQASFGLLVYQDDVLFTAIELAGYDWKEADKFRKAMGKKIPEEMEKQKKKFFDGCKEHSKLSEIKIHQLWEYIEPFAAYGFGKAHAASYGIVAYQTAYMKANYPVQYMSGVLQAESNDEDKVAAIVRECSRINIKVLPPDVNESFKNFAMVSKQDEVGRIRFGLTAIKNVGAHICEVVYEERKANGQYKDLEDLLTRIDDKDLNKKSIESFIKAGALDCFGYDRRLLLENIENILGFIREYRVQQHTNQSSLFLGTDILLTDKVMLKQAPKATMDEKLVWEKQLLGLYISDHPFAWFQQRMSKQFIPLSDVDGFDRNAWIVVGGIIDKVKKKITKKGSIMLFVTIQDTTGSMDLMVFPKTYEHTRDLWLEGKIVSIVGKTPKEQGDNKIFVEKVRLLTKETADQIASEFSFGTSLHEYVGNAFDEKSVVISMTKEHLGQTTDALKQFFANRTGEYNVYIKVGTKKIRANASIEWNNKVKKEIEEIVGDVNIDIRD